MHKKPTNTHTCIPYHSIPFHTIPSCIVQRYEWQKAFELATNAHRSIRLVKFPFSIFRKQKMETKEFRVGTKREKKIIYIMQNYFNYKGVFYERLAKCCGMYNTVATLWFSATAIFHATFEFNLKFNKWNQLNSGHYQSIFG